jgi:hypothetical protein
MSMGGDGGGEVNTNGNGGGSIANSLCAKRRRSIKQEVSPPKWALEGPGSSRCTSVDGG